MNKALNMLKITSEVLLVIVFIFFEELIWKKMAMPIKNYLASLEILQGTQIWIETRGLYETLSIFVVLLTIAEFMGIYSGILIVSGAIISGVILYGIKVGVAGLTFWIFSFTKDKLLTISWFKTVYDLIIELFDWIKSTRIYRKVRYSVYRTKRYVNNLNSTGFKDDIEHVYKALTELFKGINAPKKSKKSKDL